MFMGLVNVSFSLSSELMKTRNGFRELTFIPYLLCQCLSEQIFSEFPLVLFLVGTVWRGNNFMVMNTLQENFI